MEAQSDNINLGKFGLESYVSISVIALVRQILTRPFPFSEIFMTSAPSEERHFVIIRMGRMKTTKMGMKRTVRMEMMTKARRVRMRARGKSRTPTKAPHREQLVPVPHLEKD